MSEFKVKSGQKFVLIGDSITDCGRLAEFSPFGNGYVSMAVNLVTARYPERNIKWVNKGIGGNVVQSLVERWTADVIKEEPNWVSIAIGINNAMRDPRSNKSLEILNAFEGSYRQILNRTREETAAEILMFETFYVAGDDQQERNLPAGTYNEIIRRLAMEYKATLVPVDAAFKRAVLKRPNYVWTTGDGVHPLPAGHALIAMTFLEALGW